MELAFQDYPKFTPEMKKTHKILIPNMAPVQFRILAAVMKQAGYTCELLENCGSQVCELGLKYVHNDTCYPALLVIGQFLDALGSGKYDLDHTALIITQTGGGCRASNYIHLLRKALAKAGYGQVPVVSLNFSGLEKDSGFPMTVPMMRKLLACIYYGDLLVALRAQTEPYETHKGDAAALQDRPGDQGGHAQDRPGVRGYPRPPGAQGESGRGGRDLREVLPLGQQRSGEISG